MSAAKTPAVDLPRCGVTELPRLLCDHCDSFTMTPEERAYLAGHVELVRPRRMVRRMSNLLADRPARWSGLAEETGRPLIVNCVEPVIGLCPRCLEEFARVLADVPRLLDDLDVAIAREARFGERGVTLARAAQMDEDEGATSRNPAAVAQIRLRHALEAAHDWFDARDLARLADQLAARLADLAEEPALRRIARQVSSAASRAHRVIDAPAEVKFYGPCPDCGVEIWQPRIRKDDEKTPISCSCGYGATRRRHFERLLEGVDDRLLTVGQVVDVMELLEEPVTRDQVHGWIRHRGMPEHQLRRAKLVNGEVQGFAPVRVVRVGDVRAERRKTLKRRTSKAATRSLGEQ